MSRAILVIGESGSGKTTSFRTLDPKKTLYLDCDKKGLSWKGWKKQYSNENKNYVATSDVPTIEQYLRRVENQDLTHIDTVIIDTLNGIMIDDEMSRMGTKGYDKWIDLAMCIYDLIDTIRILRDDLTIICTGHIQTDRDDNGYYFSHLKTSGRKLDKILLESKFTTVLMTKVVDGNYTFVTQADHSTAKSPMGCFDKEIPNDMQYVINTLKKYEEEE